MPNYESAVNLTRQTFINQSFMREGLKVITKKEGTHFQKSKTVSEFKEKVPVSFCRNS